MKSLKDHQALRITAILTLVVFTILLATHFTMDSIIPSIVCLLLVMFTILANWLMNVRMPIGRVRKNGLNDTDKALLKSEKTYMKEFEFAEVIYYSKGLAFTAMSLLPLIVSIIFIII